MLSSTARNWRDEKYFRYLPLSMAETQSPPWTMRIGHDGIPSMLWHCLMLTTTLLETPRERQAEPEDRICWSPVSYSLVEIEWMNEWMEDCNTVIFQRQMIRLSFSLLKTRWSKSFLSWHYSRSFVVRLSVYPRFSSSLYLSLSLSLSHSFLLPSFISMPIKTICFCSM